MDGPVLLRNYFASGGDGNLFDDLDAEAFEAGDFARVIRQQADALEVEVAENLRSDADFALGAALAFGQRGQALFVVELQRELVAEFLDGVALRGLVEIDERAAAFVGDAAHGSVDGVAAAAPGGAEDVSHEAVGVHADENGVVGGVLDVAFDECSVGFGVDVGFVDDHAEVAVSGRYDGLDEAAHVALVGHAVADELGYGEHLEAVLTAEFGELGDARHSAVVVHDFADDAGRNERGETGEIDGGFGLSGADEDSALAGAEGEGVAGTGEVVGSRGGIDGDANGVGAIVGRDAGGDAVAGVDGFGEGGAEVGGVLG